MKAMKLGSLFRGIFRGTRNSALLVLVLCILAIPGWGTPRLPSLLSDHLVLQRDQPVHLWGWADPEERIVVRLAGARATTTAGTNGSWSVALPAMAAGGPYSLTVAGKTTVVVNDVLIGEVWVASGQSNMTYPVSRSAGGADEVQHATCPQIRFFKVPKRISLRPEQETYQSEWQVCSPEAAAKFSAVAYYFARELNRDLKVPIGILESAWEGTPIEDWLPSAAYENAPALQPIIQRWNSNTESVKRYSETANEFKLEFADFVLIGTAPSSEPLKPYPLVWSYEWSQAPKTRFELLPIQGSEIASVSGALDHTALSLARAFWNPDGTALDLNSYSGIRFKVRGNGRFRLRFAQPTITDWDDYSSTSFTASKDWQTVVVSFKSLQQEGWGVTKPFTPAESVGFAIESTTAAGYPERPPSGIYNGMIAPLLRYGVRGAIWYQGESNALRASVYRLELPALISSWRKAWNEGEFPFLVVQLPNHGAVPTSPSESAWAELREAQLRTSLSVPNTGLAVTIDVGLSEDVHPPRKREVGGRLARYALATTYAHAGAPSGPIYLNSTREATVIRTSFAHADGLRARGGDVLKGFAIAGRDRKFVWADARIEGSSVVVWSNDVPEPVAVRYGWGDSPVCNLENESGIPASPFRTDDWPGVTDTDKSVN